METQRLTEEQIKLVELLTVIELREFLTAKELEIVLGLKSIPDIGNEPPMLHVQEDWIDFFVLLDLVNKGIIERPEWDKFAEVKKKLNGEEWFSFHLTGWKEKK